MAQAVVRHYPRVGSSPLSMATRKRTYIIKCTITVLITYNLDSRDRRVASRFLLP